MLQNNAAQAIIWINKYSCNIKDKNILIYYESLSCCKGIASATESIRWLLRSAAIFHQLIAIMLLIMRILLRNIQADAALRLYLRHLIDALAIESIDRSIQSFLINKYK